jgi:hypothetical protein
MIPFGTGVGGTAFGVTASLIFFSSSSMSFSNAIQLHLMSEYIIHSKIVICFTLFFGKS